MGLEESIKKVYLQFGPSDICELLCDISISDSVVDFAAIHKIESKFIPNIRRQCIEFSNQANPVLAYILSDIEKQLKKTKRYKLRVANSPEAELLHDLALVSITHIVEISYENKFKSKEIVTALLGKFSTQQKWYLEQTDEQLFEMLSNRTFIEESSDSELRQLAFVAATDNRPHSALVPTFLLYYIINRDIAQGIERYLIQINALTQLFLQSNDSDIYQDRIKTLEEALNAMKTTPLDSLDTSQLEDRLQTANSTINDQNIQIGKLQRRIQTLEARDITPQVEQEVKVETRTVTIERGAEVLEEIAYLRSQVIGKVLIIGGHPRQIGKYIDILSIFSSNVEHIYPKTDGIAQIESKAKGADLIVYMTHSSTHKADMILKKGDFSDKTIKYNGLNFNPIKFLEEIRKRY